MNNNSNASGPAHIWRTEKNHISDIINKYIKFIFVENLKAVMQVYNNIVSLTTRYMTYTNSLYDILTHYMTYTNSLHDIY